jgi:hypothetical protein
MLARYARQGELASMALMLLGIVALCQPWSLLLHQYSVATIIAGLLAFNVFSRIRSPAPASAAAPGPAASAEPAAGPH